MKEAKIKNITILSKLPRHAVQIASTIASNSYLYGFKAKTIYTGTLKHGCVPFLNCYSCPGALFSCPIGAMQAIINSSGGFDLNALPYLVVGFLMAVGLLVGRAACGWLCPFGFIQDLLAKITPFKIKGWSYLKYLKYVILIVFVFCLPMFWLDEFDMGEPSFCKYICPAGTLEGGFTLALLKPDLRSQLGWLFKWKTSLLVLILLGSIVVKRPFCRWLCPVGAIYGPFNKISLFGLSMEKSKCVGCNACSKKCPVSLDVPNEIGSAECLQCAECVRICPTGCLKHQFINGFDCNKTYNTEHQNSSETEEEKS